MRAYDTVMAWVTSRLRSGELSIGDHLPSERALAEELGVSRNSLREALRVLEAMGMLQSATGSGPRSGTVLTAAPEQALGLALSLQLASSQVAPEHVFRVRLLLECAAMRSSDPATLDLEHVRGILEQMDQPDLSIEGFLLLDAQFHVALSRAASNPLLSALMGALRRAISDHTVELSRSLPDWPATARRLRREHAEILEALLSAGGDEAAGLLERHIVGYYEETHRPRPEM
ncbi:FadR/GntR family transcriptional regulator [Corynebacterium timonense]|uniref:DNA-binding transcriptional regulator, FadR family n=1 Tax=Corynebacterium timonense TaxID=441500 RepID=A0A1H1V5C5_9CORY|nr:GntR family transcriptional regulator [Corynebacterium timonense]SDS79903.1 DNA-binding transcriptional regulator, FadR family [Corynebacterium timonense]